MLMLAIALVSGRLMLDQHHLEHLLIAADVESEVCLVAGSPPGEPPAVFAGWARSADHSLLPAHEGSVRHSSPCPCPPLRGPPPIV